MARIKGRPAKCVPTEATWERAGRGPYVCHDCSKEFGNGHQLGGHRKSHPRSYSDEPVRRSHRKAAARARVGLSKQVGGKRKKVEEVEGEVQDEEEKLSDAE